MLLGAAGGYWGLMWTDEAAGGSWGLLWLLGGYWGLLGATGGYWGLTLRWGLLKAAGCYWVLLWPAGDDVLLDAGVSITPLPHQQEPPCMMRQMTQAYAGDQQVVSLECREH